MLGIRTLGRCSTRSRWGIARLVRRRHWSVRLLLHWEVLLLLLLLGVVGILGGASTLLKLLLLVSVEALPGNGSGRRLRLPSRRTNNL